jgi:hypothetical protein
MLRYTSAIIGSFAFAVSAHANQINNGSFETPIVTSPSEYQTIVPGSEPPGFGWQITTGNVDAVIQGAVFASTAFDGVQFLDLDGTTAGGIAQSFATTPGNSYVLTFAYANNPAGGTIPAHGTVSIIDTTSTSDLITPLLLTHGSSTQAAPDWIASGAISFIAVGTNTTLTFTSNDPSSSDGGIFLDAVSVTGSSIPQVPEPATFALMSLGLAGVCFGKRRKLI